MVVRCCLKVLSFYVYMIISHIVRVVDHHYASKVGLVVLRILHALTGGIKTRRFGVEIEMTGYFLIVA